MANLCVIGCHKVNGGLRYTLSWSSLCFKYHTLWLDKFTNVTNGVRPGAGSNHVIPVFPN